MPSSFIQVVSNGNISFLMAEIYSVCSLSLIVSKSHWLTNCKGIRGGEESEIVLKLLP